MSDYQFERDYWGDCCNTFDEDQKHYVYARLMGLRRNHYSFDVGGKSVIDIGGGPSSMLLKCVNLDKALVVDPIDYPRWTAERYNARGIRVLVRTGEDFATSQSAHDREFFARWDECWIYNCLQHTIDPEKVIANAKRAAGVLRIFEWIDVKPHEGHPHELTEDSLNRWIGGRGKTIQLAEQGCFGRAFYGEFTP